MEEVELVDHYLYTKDHEWVEIDGETATVGITEYAQASLGDITFIELPSIDDEVEQFGDFASVESVKAASDIFAPVSGSVAEVNTELEEEPGLINKSCYEKGWIAKIAIADIEEKNSLMTADEYQNFLVSSG